MADLRAECAAAAHHVACDFLGISDGKCLDESDQETAKSPCCGYPLWVSGVGTGTNENGVVWAEYAYCVACLKHHQLPVGDPE